ncbi:hypothetical protein LOTGIDRAFT_157336 [Lottia gigantea]|uniref:WW domain-containing protein n=1 Tax=Lottia gigantea TaxID=225164 RepID=V4B426_LOTGI|nr:hypothetical protein LOTGIDRAFT_157336 [Lottia gigantea]ESP02181.1 hypothetical protein LOTGIDRAFT_157336 [Lottia gigantea]
MDDSGILQVTHDYSRQNADTSDINGIQDESQTRYAELITIDNCNKGLGLKICGGCSIDGTMLHGIFIKYVIPGGVSASCGGVSASCGGVSASCGGVSASCGDVSASCGDVSASCGGVSASCGLLQNGDQILSVNDESLEGVTKERAISILKRAAGENHAEILVTRDDEARSEYIEVLEKENSLMTTPVHSPSFEESLCNSDSYLNGSLESPWKHFANSLDSLPVADESLKKTQNSLPRKTTLDPSDKFDLEKLQGRLHYLNLQPTANQLQILHQHLIIDAYNQVTFGNFMQAVKLVFEDELRSSKCNIYNKSINSTPRKSPINYTQQDVSSICSEDFLSVCQQRDELKQQIHKLEVLLQSRESKYEQELLKMRKEAQAAIDENRSLKTRVRLAEQAQTEAQTLENDYEEANGLSDSVSKQSVTLACQLKKAEAQLKIYHAATEKLVAHVEHVQDVLTQQVTGKRNNESEGIKKDGRDKRKENVTTLIQDGQTVIKLVKSLTETAPLPYGWEEAFSEDGSRYYINHITQTTSWTHPASGVQHISDKNKPSTSKSKS